MTNAWQSADEYDFFGQRARLHRDAHVAGVQAHVQFIDHDGFFAVGAYMYALLASPHLTSNFAWLAQTFPNGLHNSIWFVIPFGAGLAALFGILLGAPVLKLRGARPEADVEQDFARLRRSYDALWSRGT